MRWHPPVKRASHERDAAPKKEAGALITQITKPTLPKALRLLEFWQAHQPDGVVVGRHVPSREIAPLLSSLVLYEPVNGGEDWRIRLAGAALLRRFGRDVAGQTISALYPLDHFLILRTRAMMVVTTGAPQIDEVIIRSTERTLQHFETVHVPVRATDGTALWDMAGYFYFP